MSARWFRPCNTEPSQITVVLPAHITSYITETYPTASYIATKEADVVVSSMKLGKSLCTKGGKGEASYGKNSQTQARHARSVLHILQETLDKVQLNSPEVPFQVADLGCCTSYTIDVIIKHISKRYESSGLHLPEFCAYFSDLPGYDFHTLFQCLPDPLANHGASALEECPQASRYYFAAAVPGSFYGRLFPARSIDFFHSTFSLRCLSQVPDSAVNKRSMACNKGKIFIHGASEATANAYKMQHQRDVAEFLKARS